VAVSIKKLAGSRVLRGPLLERWVRMKDRRLDAAFVSALVRSGNQPVPPAVAPRLAAAGAVRSIALLADVMWERDQLVPELEKIAPVTLLDLGVALRAKKQNLPDHEAVAAAVEAFTSAQGGAVPDVALIYARGSLLSESVFEILRRRWRCPFFGMNLDDKVEFFPNGVYSHGNDNYQRWARQFDLNLTSSLTAEKWYRQAGLPCAYVAMGFHASSETADAPVSANFEHRISFVGSRKRERSELIEKLTGAGVPVSLFGSGWPGTRWAENINSIYRRSQINLGIGFATSTGGIVNLKARDFECPGAGACYLTSYNWELALHYEIGKEVLCYRSPEELLEMYYHYSQHPEQCLKIAQAAHRRCRAEHSWEQRFRRVFRENGFKL